MYNNKKSILDKNMDRFDFYIEKADNKASFILALVGILMSGILFQSESLVNKEFTSNIRVIMLILIIITLILLLISAHYALKIILPQTPSMIRESIMFFECIKKIGLNEYKQRIDLITEDNIIEQYVEETNELASICSNKMKFTKKSLKFLKFSIYMIGIIVILKLIVMNFKITII